MAVSTNLVFNKLTPFNGLIWRFSCRFTEEFYIVTAETLRFSNRTCKFEPHFIKLKCKLSCQNINPPVEGWQQSKPEMVGQSQNPHKVIVKIITCKVLKNYKVGLKYPHVMTQVTKFYLSPKGREVKCYHVDILMAKTVRLPDSYRLERISSFSCPVDISEPSSLFYVADGPLCINKGKENNSTFVYYCCAETPTVTRAPYCPILPYVMSREIVSLKLPISFYFMSTKGELVRESSADGCPQQNYFYSENFLEQNKVHALCFLDGTGESVPDLVMCSADEIFFFVSGKLKQFADLPLKNPWKIVCFNSGSLQTKYYVVLSRCGSACAVDAAEFKVVQRWDNIGDVLVDDFKGSGNQMLLMLHASSHDTIEEILEGAIVTDISTSQNLQNADGKDVSGSESKYFMTAVRGLEATLQTERATLDATKLKIKQKTSFIKSTVARLVNLTQTGVLPKSDNEMTVINIPPKKRILSPLSAVALVPPVESPLSLEIAASRIVPVGWLVGVKVKNVSNRTLCSFQLHLACERHSPLQYTCKEVPICGQHQQESQNGNILNISHSYTDSLQSTLLTAVMPMSQVMKVNFGGYLSVAVSFSHCFNKDPNEELPVGSLERLCGPLFHQVLGCIPLKLDPLDFSPKEADDAPLISMECIADDTEGNRIENRKFEYQFEEAACKCISLRMITPNRGSHHLACMLRETMDLTYDSEKDTLLWKPGENSLTTPISIRVSTSRKDATSVNVYYWYDNELALFLASLNNRLPGIIVVPDDSEQADLPSRVCQSLKKELALVLDLGEKAKKISAVVPGSSLEKTNIDDLRADFAEQQKVLKERRYHNISLLDYLYMQHHLLNQEITTDFLVGSLVNKYCTKNK